MNELGNLHGGEMLNPVMSTDAWGEGRVKLLYVLVQNRPHNVFMKKVIIFVCNL